MYIYLSLSKILEQYVLEHVKGRNDFDQEIPRLDV